MNRLFVRYFAAGVLLGLPGLAWVADAPPSAERGRELYMNTGCVHCHGSLGQGSAAGKRLAPNALPAPAIAAFIRATSTTMPAYSEKLLSDADVADIAAFLASIPSSAKAADIAALRDLRRKP
jgi:mono/diheme cytochrome c family protein